MVTSTSASPGQHMLQLDLNHLDILVKAAYSKLDNPQEKVFIQLRNAVDSGDVPTALKILEEHLPKVLQDLRIVFRLHKQHFVEMLKLSISDGSVNCKALEVAKAQLAPLSEVAYPEAYTEMKTTRTQLFKPDPLQVLLLVVYAGNQDVPPTAWPAEVQQLLSEVTRSELAARVYQTLLQEAGEGAQPSDLELIITYLAQIFCQVPKKYRKALQRSHSGNKRSARQQHATKSAPHMNGNNTQCTEQEGGASVKEEQQSGSDGKQHVAGRQTAPQGQQPTRQRDESDLVDLCTSLIDLGKDPVPFRDDAYSVSSFHETDVQSLVKCAHSDRAEAIDTIRHHRNKLLPALKSELMRYRLNRCMLKELLREYLEERGMETPVTSHVVDTASQLDSEDVDTDMTDSTPVKEQDTQEPVRRRRWEGRSSGGGSGGSDGGGTRRAASRSPPAKMHCSRPNSTDNIPSSLQPAQQLQHAAIDQSDGNTMSVNAVNGSDRHYESSRGSHDGAQQLHGSHEMRIHETTVYEEDMKGVSTCKDHQRYGPHGRNLKGLSGAALYARLRQIAQADGVLAFTEAVDEVCPGLLSHHHPVLLFKLRAARFTQLVNDGHLQHALELARQQLTPLAEQHPQLQQQLKACMSQLLPAGFGLPSPPGSLSQDCQTSSDSETATLINEALGLLSHAIGGGAANTRLVRVLESMLSVYRSWVKSQKIRDPFFSLLGIPQLVAKSSEGSPVELDEDAEKARVKARRCNASDATTAEAQEGALSELQQMQEHMRGFFRRRIQQLTQEGNATTGTGNATTASENAGNVRRPEDRQEGLRAYPLPSLMGAPSPLSPSNRQQDDSDPTYMDHGSDGDSIARQAYQQALHEDDSDDYMEAAQRYARGGSEHDDHPSEHDDDDDDGTTDQDELDHDYDDHDHHGHGHHDVEHDDMPAFRPWGVTARELMGAGTTDGGAGAGVASRAARVTPSREQVQLLRDILSVTAEEATDMLRRYGDVQTAVNHAFG